MNGYQALREAAAWVDLSPRGRIWVRGEDRARLLHAMCTNHVQQLTAGSGCYAFFLSAQGRILADADILCLPDRFLLDTEPETRESLRTHLDRYIIADDVTLEDATDETAAIGLEGPRAQALLAGLGVTPPESPHSHVVWDSRIVARISVTGQPGFRITVPAAGKAALAGLLADAGAVEATSEDIRVVRLERGRARYGEDITAAYLPQETQLMSAVHSNKGCYIGQEIVERIRSRGHVNRLLTPLRIHAANAPAPGARIVAGGKDLGEITSAAFSPALSLVAALGYVRAEAARPGVEVTVDDAPGVLAAPAQQ